MEEEEEEYLSTEALASSINPVNIIQEKEEEEEEEGCLNTEALASSINLVNVI